MTKTKIAKKPVQKNRNRQYQVHSIQKMFQHLFLSILKPISFVKKGKNHEKENNVHHHLVGTSDSCLLVYFRISENSDYARCQDCRRERFS